MAEKRPPSIAWATAALFVVSLGYGIIAPLIPALAARGGESDIAKFSWVYATYSAAKVLSQPVGGVLVDRLGPRAVLTAGIALYASAMAAMIAPMPLVGISVLRAMEGAAEGMVYPSVLAAVRATSSDDQFGRRFGGVLALGSSGLLLGPVLGAVFRSGGLWRPFALVTCVAVMVGLGVRRSFPRGAARGATAPRTIGAEIRRIAGALRDPEVFLPALPIAHNKLCFSGYVALFPLFIVNDLHQKDAMVAVLFLVVGLAFGLSQPIGGALVDRFAPSRVVSVALGPVLATCAFLAWPRSLVGFALLLAPHVMLQSVVLTGVMKQVATAKGTREVYGGVIGSLATGTDLFTIVGPIVMLHAYPLLGPKVFVLLAALGIVFDVPYLIAACGGRRQHEVERQ